MKKINTIVIDSSPMSASSNERAYTVTGDPGAVFSMTVTNEDIYYYNFPENTIILNSDTQTRPAPAFAEAVVRLNPVMLDSTGVYSSVITFPAVTDDDNYVLTVHPEMHYETLTNIGNGGSYIFANIQQLINTAITLDLVSADSDSTYNNYPDHYTVSGLDSRVKASPSQSVQEIDWTVTLGSSDMILVRQPLANDFFFTTAKRTKTAGTDSTSLELQDISGLSIGMAVSGTGIASGATITAINKGFYNANKSTGVFPIYDVPVAIDETDINNAFVSIDKGGTVTLSAASTLVVDRSLTFTGYGSLAAKKFNETSYTVSDFKLVLADVVTTTDAAVSNSTTIPITSTNGIKAAETTLIKGIGVLIASPHVDAVSSGVNVTASTAQTIENGQTLTFTGSSRSATITGKVTVTSYGSNNLTLKLDLDKILTVS